MSEPTIEHELIEERLRHSARIESCPQILKEAADTIAVLRRRVGRLEEVAEVARFVLANEGLIRQDSFNRMTTALSNLRSDNEAMSRLVDTPDYAKVNAEQLARARTRRQPWAVAEYADIVAATNPFEEGRRYFLRHGKGPWREVEFDEWVQNERIAGFVNTMGCPFEPATAGFGNGAIQGKIERTDQHFSDRAEK